MDYLRNKNKRIRNIKEKLMCYNLVFHYIPGETNKIADCLSRLTRRIRDAEHFPLSDPILGSYAKIKKIANKSKVEADDPWVDIKLVIYVFAVILKLQCHAVPYVGIGLLIYHINRGIH